MSGTSPKKIILGIDPGTRITGYGIVQEGRVSHQVLDCGEIAPPPKALLSDRYLAIFESVETLVSEYKPSALVVELQFVGNNAQSAIKLGMARAAVMLAAKRQRVPVFGYSPSETKRAVGHGSMSKEQVRRTIESLFQIRVSSEDAADALALALCHLNRLNAENDEI